MTELAVVVRTIVVVDAFGIVRIALDLLARASMDVPRMRAWGLALARFIRPMWLFGSTIFEDASGLGSRVMVIRLGLVFVKISGFIICRLARGLLVSTGVAV